MTKVAANHDRHLASHVFNIAILVVGVAAFGWMMHRLGWAIVTQLDGGHLVRDQHSSDRGVAG